MAATPQEESLTHAIVGLGNPLLDISADVDEAFLEKYGLQPANAILAEDKHLPLYQELKNEYKPQFVAGGATLNSIRIAQWILNSKNTKASSFFGAIGQDEFGQKMKDCVSADHVNGRFLELDDTPTGTCAVCVVKKERSLVANLSAANKFNVSFLESEESKKIIEEGQIYYTAGFHLTVSPEAVMKLATHATENNKIYTINLSAPFIVSVFKEPLLAAIPHASFVFGNETEALEFGKIQNWGEDLQVIAQKLAQLPKASGSRGRVVVFTQGDKQTIVAHDGIVETFAVPALDTSTIIDTNGAGDAFVGGFLSQLALKKPLKDCVDAGHWAAQVVIQRSGCTFPEKCEFSC